MSDEQLFKRKRAMLYGTCMLIFLLHANLSILLDKVYQHGFSKEQMDSLTGILFVALIVAFIRYHQAVITSKSWIKMTSDFVPFKRRSLYNSRILLDRTHEGESEYDDGYWAMVDGQPDYIIPEYTLEEDVVWGGSNIKKLGPKQQFTKREYYQVKLYIKWLIMKAWGQYSFHHPAVLDVFIPYLFSVLTFLEISGLFSVSGLLEAFGHLLNSWRSSTEPSFMHDLGAFFL